MYRRIGFGLLATLQLLLSLDTLAQTARDEKTLWQPYYTQLNIQGVKRVFHATDNFFWISPGEEREIELEVLWREQIRGEAARLTARAWNSKEELAPIARSK